MRRMTRKQSRHWLAPMRRALGEIKSGEVDAIRGYAVTRLNSEDEYARLDWAINGFVALLHRLEIGLDLTAADRLSKKLERGIPLTIGEVDTVLALLNQAENKLVGRPIDSVLEAVRTEQIVIELESLGLKKAA